MMQTQTTEQNQKETWETPVLMLMPVVETKAPKQVPDSEEGFITSTDSFGNITSCQTKYDSVAYPTTPPIEIISC